MSDCERIEEQLPLLAYPDELGAAAREEVEAHLAGCAGCRALREELESALEGLDRVPLERPDPARWAGLKASVLAAVAAPVELEPCPQEQELLAREALSASEAAALETHLAGCAGCQRAEREFGLVGRALDRWTVATPAGLQAVRGRVLEEVGTAAAPRGLLLRFRPLLSAAGLAAAILVGVWVSFAPVDSRAALAAADRCVLDGQFDPAKERYRQLLQDPQVSSLARNALETLQWLEAARSIPDAAARRRTLAELIARHPDAAAATPAIEELVADRALLSSSTAMGSTPMQQPSPFPRVLTYESMQVSDELRATLTDRSLMLAQRFQRALRAEVQGDVITARALYREVIELDPDSLAAQRAQERLARLAS